MHASKGANRIPKNEAAARDNTGGFMRLRCRQKVADCSAGIMGRIYLLECGECLLEKSCAITKKSQQIAIENRDTAATSLRITIPQVFEVS
jgi:transcription elongation factor Elf1